MTNAVRVGRFLHAMAQILSILHVGAERVVVTAQLVIVLSNRMVMKVLVPNESVASASASRWWHLSLSLFLFYLNSRD